jgi:hypothetical protein
VPVARYHWHPSPGAAPFHRRGRDLQPGAGATVAAPPFPRGQAFPVNL